MVLSEQISAHLKSYDKSLVKKLAWGSYTTT